MSTLYMRRHRTAVNQAILENNHNTMSTTRGIAFAALLLVLYAASCDATRGARGARHGN